VPGFLFAMAFTANAQDGKTVHSDADKAENTMDIELGGSAGLRYVFGTENVNVARGGAEDGGTWPGWATISLNVAFSDSVSLHSSLYTGTVGGGTHGYTNALGNAHGTNLDPTFQDLYVQFDDAFTDGLTLKIGSHAVSFGLMEGREVYNPRWSSVLGNAGGGQLNTRNGGETDQAGLSLNYASENIGLDIFWTTMTEGGASSADNTNTGIIFTYDLSGAVGEGSAFGAMLLWADLPGDSNFFSFNPEVLLNGLMENLGLYIRLGFNFGETNTDVDAGGINFGLGLTYSFANDSDAWIALMFDYFSGDDGDDADQQDSFLSYEAQGDGKYDMLVLEGQMYGFNLRTNYWKVALSGGMSFSVGSGRNNLHVRGLLGTAMAAEEVGNEDNWGFEIDIVADYVLNDRVSWTTGIGALLGSDLLDDQGGLGAGQDDDNAIVFFMGPDVSF
jgi:hypothetical protein